MAKCKLTPAQEEQLKNMVNAGDGNAEIVQFFKNQYQIDLPGWKLNYARNKLGKHAPRVKHHETALGGGAAKRPYHKKVQTSALNQEIPVEQAVQDIVKGLEQIREGYNAIFMFLRLAVIKEAHKVVKIKMEAGLIEKVEAE